MKIKGTDGVGPGAPLDPGEVSGEEAVEGARFEDLLEDPAGAAEGATAAQPLTELGRLLEAGELSGVGAAEALVDAVVRDQASVLNPEQAAQLRSELLRMLREDPLLARQVKALGGG